MVEIIGVATIVALCWLLASSMANESDAERRRRIVSELNLSTGNSRAAGSTAKEAA